MTCSGSPAKRATSDTIIAIGRTGFDPGAAHVE